MTKNIVKLTSLVNLKDWIIHLPQPFEYCLKSDFYKKWGGVKRSRDTFRHVINGAQPNGVHLNQFTSACHIVNIREHLPLL